MKKAFQVCSIGIIALLALMMCWASYRVYRYDNPPRLHVWGVKTDTRSIATAMESYFIDCSAYPLMRDLRDFSPDVEQLRVAGGYDLKTIEPGREGVLGLTTPFVYISSLPMDHFTDFDDSHERVSLWKKILGPAPAYHGNWGELPFAYYTDHTKGWILYSCHMRTLKPVDSKISVHQRLGVASAKHYGW